MKSESVKCSLITRTRAKTNSSRKIEAAGEAEGITMMAVPTELAPEVRALIARRHGA